MSFCNPVRSYRCGGRSHTVYVAITDTEREIRSVDKCSNASVVLAHRCSPVSLIHPSGQRQPSSTFCHWPSIFRSRSHNHGERASARGRRTARYRRDCRRDVHPDEPVGLRTDHRHRQPLVFRLVLHGREGVAMASSSKLATYRRRIGLRLRHVPRFCGRWPRPHGRSHATSSRRRRGISPATTLYWLSAP